MDAFFASVEQRDYPELRGKPIAVGSDGPRGVVSTASYEARRFGVHSAMSMAVAKRLCAELVIVPSHYEHYREISAEIHDIFRQHTEIIEPLSIDEAFLDVTDNKKGIALARDIAVSIRREIREKLCLTASVGVSYNKFLAKIASDYHKPDGLTVIHPDRALDFIARLPIEDFWGVGPKTAVVMHRMGIFTGRDLRACSLAHLQEVFGKAGALYYNCARGKDNRPVMTDRERKSVGCEQTFEHDIHKRSVIMIELYHIVVKLVDRIAASHFTGFTLTLKIKLSDFTQITRSVTTATVIMTKDQVLPLAKKLLNSLDLTLSSVRLIGLSVSNPYSGKPMHGREWIEGFLPFDDCEIPDLRG